MPKKPKIVKLNPLKTGNFRQKRTICCIFDNFFQKIRVRFSIGSFIKREEKHKKNRIFYLKLAQKRKKKCKWDWCILKKMKNKLERYSVAIRTKKKTILLKTKLSLGGEGGLYSTILTLLPYNPVCFYTKNSQKVNFSSTCDYNTGHFIDFYPKKSNFSLKMRQHIEHYFDFFAQ